MTVILILGGVLVGAGLLLYLHHSITGADKKPPLEPVKGIEESKVPLLAHRHAAGEDKDVCCGMHEVCDKMATQAFNSAEYYDDEELDAFIGREPDQYEEQECDLFREVMTTMRPSELIPWGESLRRRGINFPSGVYDEYMLLVTESMSDTAV